MLKAMTVAGFSLFALVATISLDASAQQDDNLIPNDLAIEAYQGGWRSGGSDPTKECLAHFNSKYPTKRIQIISTSEESRKDWKGHVEYKYQCTAAIKLK